jgi:hypothetical protein
MIKLLDLLLEEIDPSEVYKDVDNVQTIVDGKRNLAFIALKSMRPSDAQTVQQIIADNGLKVMYVKGNPYEAYIVYTQGSESDASELKGIAEKYGGYLSKDATREETERIGQLLGYTKQSIDDYISKRYPQ